MDHLLRTYSLSYGQFYVLNRRHRKSKVKRFQDRTLQNSILKPLDVVLVRVPLVVISHNKHTLFFLLIEKTKKRRRTKNKGQDNREELVLQLLPRIILNIVEPLHNGHPYGEKKVAVVKRFKQESMYGLYATKSGRQWKYLHEQTPGCCRIISSIDPFPGLLSLQQHLL